MLLNPEAVCAAVTISRMAVGPPGVPCLPGIVSVLLVAVEVREVAPTLSLQAGVLSCLLPHAGGVNHQSVLERDYRGGERKRWSEGGREREKKG